MSGSSMLPYIEFCGIEVTNAARTGTYLQQGTGAGESGRLIALNWRRKTPPLPRRVATLRRFTAFPAARKAIRRGKPPLVIPAKAGTHELRI